MIGILTIAYEVPRHGEDEIGFSQTYSSQICLFVANAISAAARSALDPMISKTCLDTWVAHLRTPSHGLRQNSRGNPIGRAFQQIPDERAANAETHHGELIDAR